MPTFAYETDFPAHHRYRRCGYAGGIARLPTGAAADASRHGHGAAIPAADTGAYADGCRRYANAGRYPGAADSVAVAVAISYSDTDGNADTDGGADAKPDSGVHANAGQPVANRCAAYRRPHPG